MDTPSGHRPGIRRSAKAKLEYTAHKYNCYIIECILGSPLATSEGVIDVVTNVRRKKKKY